MTNTAIITLNNALHDQKRVVPVYFPCQKEIIEHQKASTNANWSPTNRCRIIGEKGFNLVRFAGLFAGKYPIDPAELKSEPEINLPVGYPEKLQQKQNLLYFKNPVDVSYSEDEIYKQTQPIWRNIFNSTINKEEINSSEYTTMLGAILKFLYSN